MKKPATRTQYRATCPVCFREHAVAGVRLVDHGYTIPRDWHQRHGSCAGVNAPHFGTPEGLEVTKGVRKDYEAYLDAQKKILAKIPSMTTIQGVKSRDRKALLVTLTSADGHWFDEAKRKAIWSTEQNIRLVSSDIEALTKRIDGWTPADPVAVEVETGPTIHLFWERSRAKVLCTWSDGGRYTHRVSSKVEAEVTCAACRKALAVIRAEQAIKEQAEAIVESMVEKFGESTRTSYSDANGRAISEIRYRMKDVDKKVRSAACRILER